jgi:hypothetical protein
MGAGCTHGGGILRLGATCPGPRNCTACQGWSTRPAPRPDRAEYFYAGSTSLTTAIQRTLNFLELYFDGEYGPCKSFSAFPQIPYRWIQPIIVPSATKIPMWDMGER